MFRKILRRPRSWPWNWGSLRILSRMSLCITHIGSAALDRTHSPHLGCCHRLPLRRCEDTCFLRSTATSHKASTRLRVGVRHNTGWALSHLWCTLYIGTIWTVLRSVSTRSCGCCWRMRSTLTSSIISTMRIEVLWLSSFPKIRITQIAIWISLSTREQISSTLLLRLPIYSIFRGRATSCAPSISNRAISSSDSCSSWSTVNSYEFNKP